MIDRCTCLVIVFSFMFICIAHEFGGFNACFSELGFMIVNQVRSPMDAEKKEAVYSDEENQDALVEWLEDQKYWRRNGGRDHVFVASDPNALYRVIDKVKNSVLLVADFGRLRPDQGSIVKDVVIPYAHRIRVYDGDVGIENRPTLLFFMGNRYRKEVMIFCFTFIRDYHIFGSCDSC